MAGLSEVALPYPEKAEQFAGTVNRWMRGDDLLDQASSRSRHADDQHRPVVIIARLRQARETLAGHDADQLIDELFLLMRIISEAAHAVALAGVHERLVVLLLAVQQ